MLLSLFLLQISTSVLLGMEGVNKSVQTHLVATPVLVTLDIPAVERLVLVSACVLYLDMQI